ncbi:hypothetical protein BDQ12DRAFT_700027 [Crucibulum laeve]|uniref:F-box domain-containing protein n=1 Tax=Crucibulum laeve TaxID=68775 RepID=A0A5C3LRI9_9AGAR|nr:hypothetical protein BDQ12DRAFT_700027 [Crucibulum laeve]
MPIIRGHELDLIRSQLQQREAQYAEALALVRMKLNQLNPVAWLPNEILEEIFHICASWLYQPQKPKQRLAWTQVCRSWRNISFSSARLWQCIDLCEARFAREFLMRSKEAPISVVSASPLKLFTENLHIQAERVQTIDVFLFPEDMIELFRIIGPNLATLTTLSLKIPPISSTFVLDTPLPNVRRLALDCVSIFWDYCHNLTHLFLRGLTSDYSPTLSQLHDLFKRSPELESMRLESIIPICSPDSDTATNQIIHLPHLRELSISTKATAVAAILGGISIPSHTRLQLHFSYFSDLSDIFPRGLPYEVGKKPNIDCIRLSRHAAQLLTPGILPWSDEPSHVLFSLSSGTCVSVPFMLAIHTLIDTSSITILELNTGVLQDVPAQALEQFLGYACNLATLRIAFNDLAELFRILSVPRTKTSAMICPRLSRIIFSKPGDLWWHFSANWLQLFASCAREHLMNKGYQWVKIPSVSEDVVCN